MFFKSFATAVCLILGSSIAAQATTMTAVFTGTAIDMRDGPGFTGQPTGVGRSIDPAPVTLAVSYNTAVGEAYSNNFGGFFLAGGTGFAIDPAAFPTGPISEISLTVYGSTYTVTQDAIGSSLTFNQNRLTMNIRRSSPLSTGNNEDVISIRYDIPASVMPDDFATPFSYSAVSSTLGAFSFFGPDEFFGTDSAFSGNLELTSVRVQPAAAVPLPAGLPLLLAGLGAIGYVARRRVCV